MKKIVQNELKNLISSSNESQITKNKIKSKIVNKTSIFKTSQAHKKKFIEK